MWHRSSSWSVSAADSDATADAGARMGVADSSEAGSAIPGQSELRGNLRPGRDPAVDAKPLAVRRLSLTLRNFRTWNVAQSRILRPDHFRVAAVRVKAQLQVAAPSQVLTVTWVSRQEVPRNISNSSLNQGKHRPVHGGLLTAGPSTRQLHSRADSGDTVDSAAGHGRRRRDHDRRPRDRPVRPRRGP